MKNQEKILHFYRAQHRMPSYSEMEKILGYKSKSAVSYFVNKLIERGVLSKDSTGKLIPKNLGELKVLGLVEAGFPTSASEELLDTMSLDEYLIENTEASFLLKVKGDSMKDAGIVSGDLVIVERGKSAKDGDIVIAEIDGEYTMKYYRNAGKRIFLEPANKKYKNIYPKNELQITAVVKGVVRKYGK
ncbi:MAG: transcriptional repressor LexA [Minisyncoccia bacterium]